MKLVPSRSLRSCFTLNSSMYRNKDDGNIPFASVMDIAWWNKEVIWPEIRASLPNKTCKMPGACRTSPSFATISLVANQSNTVWLNRTWQPCLSGHVPPKLCCPDWSYCGLKNVQQPSTNRSSPVKNSTRFKLHVDAAPSKLQQISKGTILDQRFSFQVAKLPEEAMIVPQPSEILWVCGDWMTNQLSVNKHPGKFKLYCLVSRDSPFLDYAIIIYI